jgi:protein O-GlcNAc transferase
LRANKVKKKSTVQPTANGDALEHETSMTSQHSEEPITKREQKLRVLAQKKPEDPLTWYTLAQFLESKERYDEAIVFYRKAISCNHADSYTSLGMLLIELGRAEEADEIFRKRASCASSDLVSWIEHARKQIEHGEHRAAMYSIRQCMEKTDQNAEVWYLLASIHFKQGNLKKAQTCIQRALGLQDDLAEGWKLQGLIFHGRGKRKDALKAFLMATKLEPSDSQAWASLGVAYANLRNNAAAMEALQRAVDLDVENRMAWKNLAKIYRAEGRVVESDLADERSAELEKFANGK